MTLSSLEAGYLAQLFDEPLYLMGYEIQQADLVETPSVTFKTEEIKDVKEEIKIPKIESKPIPVTPKLQAISQKIAKKCILLFMSEENELSTKEVEFLSKVMAAVKLQKEEYETVNFNGITIMDIASRYAFDKLVLFGVRIPGLDIEQYRSTQVKSTRIISADPVWMVESNTALKKQLWDQLQAMFGVSK